MDLRRQAIYLGRARALIGLSLLFSPKRSAALWGGHSAGESPGARLLARTTGVRDVALGLGIATAAAQRQGGADWLSMGALADLGDAVAFLATPRLPIRSRLLGLGAAGAAYLQFQTARRLATEEEA